MEKEKERQRFIRKKVLVSVRKHLRHTWRKRSADAGLEYVTERKVKAGAEALTQHTHSQTY